MNRQMSALELATEFHGHKCPAVALGVRIAFAAMKVLEVQRAMCRNLYCVCETGVTHVMMCFADGVQAATGCTFGKGNMETLNYDKLAMTLIDLNAGRGVRVMVDPEVQERTLGSEYFKRLAQEKRCADIPAATTARVLDYVLSVPQEQVAVVGAVRPFHWDIKDPSGEWHKCDKCGEITFAYGLRLRDGKRLCIPCSRLAQDGEASGRE